MVFQVEPTSRDIRRLREPLSSELAGFGRVRLEDGWREPIAGSLGYRYAYDREFAEGGWEFHQLQRGLCFLTVDMVARQTLFRRHSFRNKLVLSAVLNGGVEIRAPRGAEGELSNGYCTLYGMNDDAGFETIYEPGQSLRWVSVIIDRDLLYQVTGLTPHDMPECIRDFTSGESTLPYRNVPLSRAASLSASQILECRYEGGFRKAFLGAKALELLCLVLFTLKSECQDTFDGVVLSRGDYAKLERAKRYIERSLDEPPNIAELAYAVGMTRQKLQFGFRRVYGDTVGKVRDKLRIEHALNLVRMSQLSMIEIAMEAGYEHPASFTRAFKAAYDMSPMQMRRMSQETALSGRLLKS